MANYVNATLETTLDNINDCPELQNYLDPQYLYDSSPESKFRKKSISNTYSYHFEYKAQDHILIKTIVEEYSKKWTKETFVLSVSEEGNWHATNMIYHVKNGHAKFVEETFNYWITCKYQMLDKKLEREIEEGIEYLKSLDTGKKFSKYEITIKVQIDDFAIDVCKNDNFIEIKNLRKKVVKTTTEETWQPISTDDPFPL